MHVFTARFLCGPKCTGLFGTMSKRKIQSCFGSERGKTIDREEEETENEFTHEDKSREENDTQLPNSKPCNFQTKWLNDHKTHKNWPQKQAKYFSPQRADDK